MIKNTQSKIGEEKYNNHGCLMKIIIYNSKDDITVEFQDEYKARIHTNYSSFLVGSVKNPYYPSVYNVGVIGIKHPISIDGENTKEYTAWRSMLKRCYNKEEKERYPKYKDVICCEKWLNYENFYEWLHSQENFDKWLKGEKWCLDKDILVKGNKVYSPETCCLVPQNVNTLFIRCDAARGSCPVGVSIYNNKYISYCSNPFTNKREHLGSHQTVEQAFKSYKKYKENIIKQVAQEEYSKGNITRQCYEAMINYEVEITD